MTMIEIDSCNNPVLAITLDDAKALIEAVSDHWDHPTLDKLVDFVDELEPFGSLGWTY